MIKKLELHKSNVLKQLFKLQRTSYLVEAELIQFNDIPPLRETIEELKNCAETIFGYYVDETLAGAISYTTREHTLTICRMVVHPDHFRKGIAQKLLKKVEEQNPDISVLYVSTGKDNPPAKNLYLKNGFTFVSDQEVIPGLFISHFKKEKHHPE